MGGHSCPSDLEGKMPLPTRGFRAPSPIPRGVPQRLLLRSAKGLPGTPPLSQDLLSLATSSAPLLTHTLGRGIEMWGIISTTRDGV